LGRKGQGPLGVNWSNEDYWVIDTAYTLKPLTALIDLRFSYYLIGLIGLNHLKDGTSNPTLSREVFGSQAFPVPPLADQARIASVLTSLDDKVALNGRMNQTLEQMARAIFKDWFVDFGPTLAKMGGSAPYLAPNIWASFPDRFDDEGRPEAWTVGTLADYANLNPENWSRVSYPLFVRYVDLSGTKWGTIENIELHSRDDAPSRAQRVLRPGDTIVGMVRPGNGSYAFVSEDGLTGSTGFAVLRPVHPDMREFVYLAVTSRENIDRLAHLADGAAYPAVRPEVVMATATPIVASPVMQAFSRTTGPLIDRMEANKREDRTLAATRDLLLPKLMSGEIRIKDAEKVVEAVL
jgi:type I restriction enzyme S subunit